MKEFNKKVCIVTHSSKFHTDDIFAVATLLIYLKNSEVEIVRSREKEVIDAGDFVVDVGDEYSPEKNRFDHHQEGGAGKRDDGVPYASFGLVWKQFGEHICGEEVAKRIDTAIVRPVDANDNGVNYLESKIPDLFPIDSGFITHIFSPTWKEDDIDIDQVFLRLVGYAKIFLERVILVEQHSIEGEIKVLEDYEKAKDKRVIETDERYPWQRVLMNFPETLYVIYKKRVDNNWSIKCINKDVYSFEVRKKLPESWAGKRDIDLENVTGVSGSTFCHNGRFMAVAKTKEGIEKMAKIALDY